ncbi:hypothetical protein QBL02_13100 [Leucobacter sp. UT-8R-CII-1-4]|uniref:DUF7341 domain-containing protein n=1 Tax=Leucobacter sp. UT-8R-CII-1-4 TaxID=3040075 RepID=UPI0024A9C414|nr:hypothetical protein [Leucobacter sp. UT-8R-CII-1-4]MDI6024478.1 hypothetical protein [Leucobacter sp. UT-8R-CII-1-4]
MESTERAVVRLTEAHTEMTEAGAVEWPPLLSWLDNAVTEQVKRGGAGSGGTGSPIDMNALALLQRIEHGVKQMREALYLGPQREIVTAIVDTWRNAKTYRARGELDDQQWERITEAFPAWVAEIEQEWDDRTRIMEVTVPCPSCGERWILEEDTAGGEKRQSAIIVEYAEGRAPTAECRAAECGGFWVGWADVARLGFTLGAEQNLEILQACGIDLGDTITATLHAN